MLALWLWIYLKATKPPSTVTAIQSLMKLAISQEEKFSEYWDNYVHINSLPESWSEDEKGALFCDVKKIEIGNKLQNLKQNLQRNGIVFPTNKPEKGNKRLWWKHYVVWVMLDVSIHDNWKNIPGANVFSKIEVENYGEMQKMIRKKVS